MVNINVKKGGFKNIWRLFKCELSLKDLKTLLDLNETQDIKVKFKEKAIVEYLFSFEDVVSSTENTICAIYFDDGEDLQAIGYYIDGVHVAGYHGINDIYQTTL